MVVDTPTRVLADHELDIDGVSACLADAYGLSSRWLRFIPSHDSRAATYEASAADGSYFLKVRSGPVHGPGHR